MWHFLDNHIAYKDDGKHHFLFSLLEPDWGDFKGQNIHIEPYHVYQGYDDWVGHFSRESELSMVEKALNIAQGSRVHIRGISTLEGVEMIRGYYRRQGYEDTLAKNYILPDHELLTVSVSLGHALWCEKDKAFLSRKHDTSALGYATPPFRTPADLRSIQQALRMGIIMGIECPSAHEPFLSEILTRQILPAYQMAKSLSTQWIYHGFTGINRDISLPVPTFSDINLDN